MYFDIQKANSWKRLSAFVLDAILLAILAVLFMWLITLFTGYDRWNTTLQDGYSKYETQYGVKFDIDAETYQRYPAETRALYDTAYGELLKDDTVMQAYRMVVNLSLLSVSLGFFFAYLILEFLVPLFLENGMTLGKKIFGICVMRQGQTKISNLVLFIRTILGKYAIETMVPVMILFMIYFNTLGSLGLIIIAAILLGQFLLFVRSSGNSLIHDVLADTIVVDYISQKIFDTEEEKLEAKKVYAKEKAQRETY